MIHVFIGTKAQFIKMAPILKELQSRGKSFNLIDAGQHRGLTAELLQQFGIGEPDVVLRHERSNIKTVPQALAWSMWHFLRILFTPRRNLRQIFKGQGGVCLIHGDTLTTLISLLYAKRCGLFVAHVEAGLWSFNLLDPFPEEIIRRIAMCASDLLFAPSDSAFQNLLKMGYGKKAVQIGANTGLDSVRYAVHRMKRDKLPSQPYAVVTIHRMETIFSYTRLKTIVETIRNAARERAVMFVLHEPTRNQLRRLGLLRELLEIENVTLLPLLSYLEFIGFIAGADYVITDGGSIQEECYYLNKPCMVLRARTERKEGIGENAFLAEFDKGQIGKFFQSFPSLKRRKVEDAVQPSALIVDRILLHA
jgi:UDP-N-acetylglucosamine 2-epimerase (non-hydrolysing)